jgi:hypothetical protein
MGLPLPRVIPDVGPGGPLVTAMRGINALQGDMLKNKYYAPNIQSEIDQRNSLTQGQNISNQYLPDKLRLANTLAQLHNQYYGPNIESEISNRNALTDKYNTMTPLEAEQLKLKNAYYPDVTKSNIASQKAIANYRNMGGTGMGVGQKELMGLQNQLSLEHPDWTPIQANQAASAYINGDEVLADGTPLPPISGLGRTFLNNIAKRGTTSALVTSGVKANQAEAELEVLNKYANEGLKPYGTTYFNKSPQQIMDTFKSDPESQKRLGKFIASQALQYEAAQNRIRLANGQPGVSSTEELMKLSGQLIQTKYPRLTQKAREEATKFMDEALKKGLQARQSIETGASGLRGNKHKKEKSDDYDVDYDKPSGSVAMTKDGELYFIPSNKVKEAKAKGYQYEK